MPDFSGLLETVKIAALDAIEATKPVAIIFGTVINTSPLQIYIEQKKTLEGQQLILTRNVTTYTLEIAIDGTTEDAAVNIDTYHNHNYSGETAENLFSDTPFHTHGYSGQTDGSGGVTETTHNHAYNGTKQITINNSLVVGDKVILLREQGGQRHIVLDRTG